MLTCKYNLIYIKQKVSNLNIYKIQLYKKIFKKTNYECDLICTYFKSLEGYLPNNGYLWRVGVMNKLLSFILHTYLMSI